MILSSKKSKILVVTSMLTVVGGLYVGQAFANQTQVIKEPYNINSTTVTKQYEGTFNINNNFVDEEWYASLTEEQRQQFNHNNEWFDDFANEFFSLDNIEDNFFTDWFNYRGIESDITKETTQLENGVTRTFEFEEDGILSFIITEQIYTPQ